MLRPSNPSAVKRLLSAVILAPIALQFVWLGGWAYAFFVGAAVALMAWEWGNLQPIDPAGLHVGRIAGLLAGMGAILAVIAAEAGWIEHAIVGLLICATICAFAARRVNASRFASALGMLYLGLPAVAMIWLRNLPGVGLPVIITLLGVIWATDICAYLVGRRFGGPKLAPRISPGKTWSGLGGGMIGAMVVAAGAVVYFTYDGDLVAAVLFAGLLAVVAQIGDLFESAMKRRAGLKDSSKLIPGHGGMLDRVDGLLFAAPVLAVVWLLFGRNIVP